MRTDLMPLLVSQAQNSLYIWLHAYSCPGSGEQKEKRAADASFEAKPSDAKRRKKEKPISYCMTHPVLGRLYAVPVAILDTALGTLVYPLSTIENLVLCLFNVLGALFKLYQNEYPTSINDAVICLDVAGKTLGAFVFSVLLFPIKLTYQLGHHLKNPTQAQSFIY